MEGDTIETTILDIAISDSYGLVRQHAFELLTEARIKPTGASNLLSRVISDVSAQVRKAWVSYLGAVGDTQGELRMIGVALVDSDAEVRREADNAKAIVLARINSARVLDELMNNPQLDLKRIVPELQNNAAQIDRRALLNAIGHSSEDVRLYVIEELKRRGDLTLETLHTLKEDKSSKVREFAYKTLLELGQVVEPDDVIINVSDETYNRRQGRNSMFFTESYANPEAIVLEIYKSRTEAELWELVDWQSSTGATAYKALALYHFPDVSGRLRGDLDEEFQTYEDGFIETEAATLREYYESGSDLVRQSISSPYSSFLGSILTRRRDEAEDTPEAAAKRSAKMRKVGYISAALSGLSSHGEAEDLKYGRKYLRHDDYDVQVEAVRVVARFGDESDAPALIEIARLRKDCFRN